MRMGSLFPPSITRRTPTPTATVCPEASTAGMSLERSDARHGDQEMGLVWRVCLVEGSWTDIAFALYCLHMK